MVELTITYTDENSERQTVSIDGDQFVIGRHSECDLSVPDSRLSRRHLKIERFADVFVASDLGSSNGSMLNGAPLDEPKAIADGDVLDLGGLEFLVTDEAAADKEADADESGQEAAAPAPAVTAASAPASRSPFASFFILGPLLALGLLLILGFGIVIYSVIGGKEERRAGSDFPTPYDDIYDDATPEPSPESSSSGAPSPEASSNGSGGELIPTPDTPATDPSKLDEEEKLRVLVVTFMRSIAMSDPNPVITSDPLSLIKNKISQYRGSTALGANLEDALRSSAQIEALAKSKSMRPAFVATAALAKLGGTRGSVVATANEMIGPLSELRIQIGDGFANECVVIIAAYDQGVAGRTLAMRDTMMKLATENQETTSRKVRTIWYLRDKGKLSDAEFELALRFLAIGTIAQNPQMFGINAQPLRFN